MNTQPCRLAARFCVMAVGSISACVRAPAPPEGPAAASGEDVRAQAPVLFQFSSTDGVVINTASVHGKPTFVVLMTTWDLASQAQVEYLAAMAKHDGARVNYLAIALQQPKERELVDLYRNELHVPFPILMADPATLRGDGPFGDVQVVPAVMLLDRSARLKWRKAGLVQSDELRKVLKDL